MGPAALQRQHRRAVGLRAVTHLHTAGAPHRPAALLGLQDDAGQRVVPGGVPPATPVGAVQVEEDAGGGLVGAHSTVQGHGTDGPRGALGGHLLEEMGVVTWCGGPTGSARLRGGRHYLVGAEGWVGGSQQRRGAGGGAAGQQQEGVRTGMQRGVSRQGSVRTLQAVVLGHCLQLHLHGQEHGLRGGPLAAGCRDGDHHHQGKGGHRYKGTALPWAAGAAAPGGSNPRPAQGGVLRGAVLSDCWGWQPGAGHLGAGVAWGRSLPDPWTVGIWNWMAPEVPSNPTIPWFCYL